MSSPTKNRVESIDLLKGLVMVIMALDHTRDYFHTAAFIYEPTDPMQTTLLIYLTRWITHFCAPVFCFLAGISVFFVGLRKSTSEVSTFLLKRGLWLVFIEMTIVNFAWYFDVQMRTPGFLVIWSLGISMLGLAVLIHLPKKFILIFSCLVIFGHNLMDNIHYEGNYFWAILHDARIFEISSNIKLYAYYPVIPWITVMSLGYCFGTIYEKSFDNDKRKKILKAIGIDSIVLFIIVRGVNIYGDPLSWVEFDSFSKTFMSFMNPTKYPPSLSYLLMTLGPALLFLANAENLKGWVVNFFCIFGRVPFFYYILHLYLIHGLAMLFAELTGFGWKTMILDDWVTYVPALKGYGFSLGVTYLVWLAVITLLYPLCKKFDAYKVNHKDQWWLTYL
ncbi:MAG: heparan-alpha-glucosaminide N-acetyltransferase domain-containing protein [Bacteroidetes bacterium]|nr:heparan-alpha-glucosaminide N-acetyltransferase domain-containing protein [Bacteroidota bacterium]MDA1122386.1 heparan-alpha-glucosaminide N-acetyltransferase domain-containing protein [Bacteroidota bacterium]